MTASREACHSPAERAVPSGLEEPPRLIKPLTVIRYELARALIKLHQVRRSLYSSSKDKLPPPPPAPTAASGGGPPCASERVLKLFLITCYLAGSLGSLLLLGGQLQSSWAPAARNLSAPPALPGAHFRPPGSGGGQLPALRRERRSKGAEPPEAATSGNYSRPLFPAAGASVKSNDWIPIVTVSRPVAEPATAAESRHRQQYRRPAEVVHLRQRHLAPRPPPNHLSPGPPRPFPVPPLRPRQQPNKPAKLYRRVLLCEKSLVSLEYVKHPVNLEQLHYETDFNFDDNSLDFDSTEPLYAAASGVDESDDDEDVELFNLKRRAPSMAYLSDEDPLVGCDMWDLEKGLKNRKPPHFILRLAQRTDFHTFREAINRCRQLSEKNVPPDEDSSYRSAAESPLAGADSLPTVAAEDLLSLMSMKRGLIPGTKWCGLGDQATSYNDLGAKHRIDICCRAHDHCPIRLKPFRNDYGVINIALYTKSHCDCDADFYRCLRDARSKTADLLGNLYFNVMKLQCIREERVKECREMRPLALGFERCVRYADHPGKRVFRFTTPPVAY